MLTEIYCDKFIAYGIPRGKIKLHAGLNTVLGDEGGANSIGKSTFLMVIDFVFGGNDYIKKLKDVQTEIGAHRICFSFLFEDRCYHFSRSTANPKYIECCDADYRPSLGNRLYLTDYLNLLQKEYGLELYDLTFRNAVSRSSRIYKRETLEEDRPLKQAKKEKDSNAILNILRLFDLYKCIAEYSKAAEDAEENYKTLNTAINKNLVKSVKNKKEQRQIQKKVEGLKAEQNNILEKSEDGLLDADSFHAELIAEKKAELSKLRRQKTILQSQYNSILSDYDQLQDGNLTDFNELLEFFPEANIKKLSEIEQFHQSLTTILNEQFSEKKAELQEQISNLEKNIKEIESSIVSIGASPNMSRELLLKYASNESQLAIMQAANDQYEQKNKLKDVADTCKKNYADLLSNQTILMQLQINTELLNLNNFIYSGTRTAPTLNIISEKIYNYFTPRDGGTGTQYRGLILFDLALMRLTKLPFAIHDSILLKQIEDSAIEKILQLYLQTEKQVFIALDKKSSYSLETQKILENTLILQLEKDSGALFGKVWNKTAHTKN